MRAVTGGLGLFHRRVGGRGRHSHRPYLPAVLNLDARWRGEGGTGHRMGGAGSLALRMRWGGLSRAMDSAAERGM